MNTEHLWDVAHIRNTTQGLGKDIYFKALGHSNFCTTGLAHPAFPPSYFHLLSCILFCELFFNYFRDRVEHISINTRNFGTMQAINNTEL